MSQIESNQPPASGARRYPRTFGGLIGSMVVLVIAVLIYWGLQTLTHEHPDIKPAAVDYRETVQTVQGAGYTVAYPPSLPSGWKATSVRFTPGDRPVWGLGILTKSGRYAGIELEDADLRDLLATYVDKNPKQGKDVAILHSGFGIDPLMPTTWTTWSDSGGDHALASTITVKGRPLTLLVYGSATLKELSELANQLTTSPLPSQQ